ncbi:MAG TPA: YCF48-related protein [Ignavibacteria bacterium]|nr:YCF48-related protein [Ignavibacteria bacterium]
MIKKVLFSFFIFNLLFVIILKCSAQTGFAIGESGTLLKTTNGGINWTSQASGTNQVLWSSFFLNPSTGWIVGGTGATDIETSLILKTTNGGATWVEQNAGVNHWLTSACFINAQTGWIAGSGRTVLKTTNGGTNWNVQMTDQDNLRLEEIWFVNENTGWVSAWAGIVLKTTNGGANWLTLNTGTPEDIYSLKVLSPTVAYGAGEHGVIIKTTNGGNNWTILNSGTTMNLFSIHFNNLTTGWVVGHDGKILKTTNEGATWISQPSGTTVRLESVDFLNDLTGWAVGGWTGSVILKTTNGGTNWTALSSGINESLFSINFPRGVSGIEPVNSSSPEGFHLYQNYPNPFNPSTTIPFSITKPGLVKIAVYDMLGKQVAELVNQNKQAGSYKVNFNSDKYSLTNGIYFYKFTSGDFSEVKKMMLVK